QRRKYWRPVDYRISPSPAARLALSPGNGSWPVVRAALRVAAAGFGLGAARALHVGILAAIRHLGSRAARLQHFTFSRPAAVSPDWISGSSTGEASSRLHRLADPRTFFQQP